MWAPSVLDDVTHAPVVAEPSTNQPVGYWVPSVLRQAPGGSSPSSVRILSIDAQYAVQHGYRLPAAGSAARSPVVRLRRGLRRRELRFLSAGDHAACEERAG